MPDCRSFHCSRSSRTRPLSSTLASNVTWLKGCFSLCGLSSIQWRHKLVDEIFSASMLYVMKFRTDISWILHFCFSFSFSSLQSASAASGRNSRGNSDEHTFCSLAKGRLDWGRDHSAWEVARSYLIQYIPIALCQNKNSQNKTLGWKETKRFQNMYWRSFTVSCVSYSYSSVPSNFCL